MKTKQKNTLAAMLALTFLASLMHLLGAGNLPTALVEYSSTLLLFLLALGAGRTKGVSLPVKLAFFFSLIGDLFLAVLPNLIPGFSGSLPGMGFFLLAYVALSAAFWKNVGIASGEKRTALILLLLLAGYLTLILPWVEGFMQTALVAFCLVIAFMAWMAVTTLLRGWFTRRASWLIAIGAMSIVISDMIVGLVLFHPVFADPSPWIKILIRFTYTPAWTLFLLMLHEEKHTAGKNVINNANNIH